MSLMEECCGNMDVVGVGRLWVSLRAGRGGGSGMMLRSLWWWWCLCLSRVLLMVKVLSTSSSSSMVLRPCYLVSSNGSLEVVRETRGGNTSPTISNSEAAEFLQESFLHSHRAALGITAGVEGKGFPRLKFPLFGENISPPIVSKGEDVVLLYIRSSLRVLL